MNIRNIASISAGYPFRGRIAEDYASGVVAVQMKNIRAGKIDWQDCRPVKLTGRRNPDFLREGDILQAARGMSNYAVLVDEGITKLHAAGFQVVAAPHFYVVRLPASEANQSARVLPEYLAWFLNQGPSQRYFEQNAEGSVTKSIRRGVLEQLPVAIPTVEKQQVIIGLAAIMLEQQKLMEKTKNNTQSLLDGIVRDLLNEARENS